MIDESQAQPQGQGQHEGVEAASDLTASNASEATGGNALDRDPAASASLADRGPASAAASGDAATHDVVVGVGGQGGGFQRLWPLALVGILLLAGWFRFTGLDWDSGQHLHPDERFLTMVASALSLPQDMLGYMDTDTSRLNPRNVGHDFYVYGTWPMTIVRLAAEKLQSTDFYSIYMVGRQLSVVYDLLGVLLIFGIGYRLFGWRQGLLASALAAGTAFSIQQAHFFTADIPANFFFLCFLFFAVGMVHKGKVWEAFPAGIGMGMALASKISLWPMAPVAMLALAFDAEWRGNRREDWLRWTGIVALLGFTAFFTLRFCQPDMFAGPGWPNVEANPARYTEVTSKGVVPEWWYSLDEHMPDALKPHLLPDPRWAENLKRISGQVQGYGMDWPPNHQWWGRADWLFPLSNMVRWGMGWPLGIAAWAAFLLGGIQIVRRKGEHLILPWLWTLAIFGYYGAQWGKTMRYFLPIYPTLILLASWMLVAWWDRARKQADTAADGRAGDPTGSGIATRLRALVFDRRVALAGLALVAGGTLLWGYMFSQIYTREHSRILASRYIYHNIPTAFGLRVEDGVEADFGPISLLPAQPPSQLSFEAETYRYTLEPGFWVGPARVLVPLDEAVTVDGVQLANVSGAGRAGEARIEAVVSASDQLDEAGDPRDVLSRGSAAFALGDEPQIAAIDLPAMEVVPEPDSPRNPRGFEKLWKDPPAVESPGPVDTYYLWLRVDGDPVSGRTTIFADQTTWDDTVPRGIDGYGPWDQAETTWAEGMYGFEQINLYHEDRDPQKVEWTLDGLAKADYTIATSNRVYGAVAQLPTRYPATIHLYDSLFGEQYGFEHAATINSVPSLGPIRVNDQPAEEAFHVYDHPQIDIWDVRDADLESLRAALVARSQRVTWQWPSDDRSFMSRYLPFLSPLVALIPGRGEGSEDDRSSLPAEGALPEDLMLSEGRLAAETERADYVFDPGSLVNQHPWLAVLVWYLSLTVIGIAAFPLVATALPNLADRGWSIARSVGLLVTSWSAWMIASLGLVDHKPPLVMACVLLLAIISALASHGRWAEIRDWLRRHRRLILSEELVFLAIFAIFLAIRYGNPDLWHPYYGGEKPMDFAYLNATLRSVSFPPFDPWFAGGTLNYYYFGFVFIGALMELTGIVPWIAYNLAIPSLAAMTGLGVFGAVYCWSRAMKLRQASAESAGVLGAILAVLSGNLFQVPFIAEALASRAPAPFQSELPGVALLVNAIKGLAQIAPVDWLDNVPIVNSLLDLGSGAWQVLVHPTSLPIQTGHWYWNASRAIPPQGDTVAITEMPFFTFVYADLHAHMMALPITVIALMVAISWARPTRGEMEGWWFVESWGLLRLGLGALAIGALWPANTWDFPTYGLVAAGALAAGLWQRKGGPSWSWVGAVGLRGGLLLGLSLLLFLPYHSNYLTPYSEFRLWRSVKTPLSAYLTVHGIFLFAMVSWALLRLFDALRDAEDRGRALAGLIIGGLISLASLYWLWGETTSTFMPGAEFAPDPRTPMLAGALLALGLALLFLRKMNAPERFAAWILVLGLFATQFVEFVVLAGDIGRMNTVFKFYIQIWILWAFLAACSFAWLRDRWQGSAMMRELWSGWRLAFSILVACGLVYTVTAARAKVSDRFHAGWGMPEEDRLGYENNFEPGLSGIEYLDYAYYAEDNASKTNPSSLKLSHDRDAFLWLLENIEGSPTVLEAYNYNGGYRWGARYSIYTGLPSVLGWDWHQKQQRNAAGGWIVDERARDIGEIYNSVDDEITKAFLDKYHVGLIIVGEQERVLYDEAGLAKFDRWAEEGLIEKIYEAGTSGNGKPAVIIYRIPESA